MNFTNALRTSNKIIFLVFCSSTVQVQNNKNRITGSNTSPQQMARIIKHVSFDICFFRYNIFTKSIFRHFMRYTVFLFMLSNLKLELSGTFGYPSGMVVFLGRSNSASCSVSFVPIEIQLGRRVELRLSPIFWSFSFQLCLFVHPCAPLKLRYRVN